MNTSFKAEVGRIDNTPIAHKRNIRKLKNK